MVLISGLCLGVFGYYFSAECTVTATVLHEFLMLILEEFLQGSNRLLKK